MELEIDIFPAPDGFHFQIAKEIKDAIGDYFISFS